MYLIPYRFNKENKIKSERQIRKNKSLSPIARLLLWEIMDMVNYIHKRFGSDTLQIRRDKLSNNLGISKQYITEKLTELQKAGFIKRIRIGAKWYLGILPDNFFSMLGETNKKENAPIVQKEKPPTIQSEVIPSEIQALCKKLGIQKSFVNEYSKKPYLYEALQFIEKNYPSKIKSPTGFFVSWLKDKVAIPKPTEHNKKQKEKKLKLKELDEKMELQKKEKEKLKLKDEEEAKRQKEVIQSLLDPDPEGFRLLLEKVGRITGKNEFYNYHEKWKQNHELWTPIFFPRVYQFLTTDESKNYRASAEYQYYFNPKIKKEIERIRNKELNKELDKNIETETLYGTIENNDKEMERINNSMSNEMERIKNRLSKEIEQIETIGNNGTK